MPSFSVFILYATVYDDSICLFFRFKFFIFATLLQISKFELKGHQKINMLLTSCTKGDLNYFSERLLSILIKEVWFVLLQVIQILLSYPVIVLMLLLSIHKKYSVLLLLYLLLTIFCLTHLED